MKMAIAIVYLLIFCIFFTSCDDIKDVQRKSSKFELRQLIKETETTKSSYGSYFLVAAQWGSSETNKTTIKCFAKVEGRYRMLDIPIEDIRVCIDDSLKIPYVQVEYNSMSNYPYYDGELLLNNGYDVHAHDFVYVIYCPQVYLPENLVPIKL
jgi:hypothetical protein